MGMSGISPQVNEEKPGARLNVCPHFPHELDVVCRRKDMDGIRHDERVVTIGKRVFEQVSFHQFNAASLGLPG